MLIIITFYLIIINMSKKVISINPQFLQITKNKKKKKEKKQLDFSTVKPNNIKKELIKRIKDHKHLKEKELEELNKKNNIAEEKKQDNAFVSDFKNTIDYLQNLSSQRKDKKKRKNKTMKNNKTLKNRNTLSNIPEAPPYGILKGGKKPTYSQYRKTLKIKTDEPTSRPNITINTPTSDVPIKTDEFFDRKNKLEKLKKTKQKVKLTDKKKKRMIYLGKRNGSVGILIKNKKTRKRIKKEVNILKKKSLVNIKKYLRKHNLIKIGSSAPENLLRELYENSFLSGDVYNKNPDVLVHNYMENKF